MPIGKLLDQFWIAFNSIKLEDTRTRLTIIWFSKSSFHRVCWPCLKSLSHANRLDLPPLFIRSHPLVWLDLFGCAGASQKASTPPPPPRRSLHLYPPGSQIKHRLREGDFWQCRCSVLTPRLERKKRGVEG